MLHRRARSRSRSRSRSCARASLLLGIVLGLIGLLGACGKGKTTGEPSKSDKPGDKPALERTQEGQATGTPTTAGEVTLPPAPPLPEVPLGLPRPAPVTRAFSPELVALGEALFVEASWSADHKTACSTCHDPKAGYSGERHPTALGRPNLRRPPPLVNVAWQRELGWDGRFASLPEHLAAHLHGQLGAEPEQALTEAIKVPVLRAHFARALGREPAAADALAALAAFVSTRYLGATPWDQEEREARGDERGRTLRAGYALFVGKAQCAVCHPPPLYTDLGYHRLGLIASADEGRGRSDPSLRGAFKTPTLRGAAARPRFFHDASASTLAAAIDWHLEGGRGQGAAASIVDPALSPIGLTALEREQLLAFVTALTPTEGGESRCWTESQRVARNSPMQSTTI